MSLLKSMATVSGFTALSRVLGFLRDILLARYLGTGRAADAFFAAFKFPNLFRRIFGEGAFNAAFVPLFGRELNEKGKEEAVKFASQTFSMLALVLSLLTALAIPLMYWVTMVHAPGFRAAESFTVGAGETVEFKVKVRSAKSIYLTVDGGGDAEIQEATLSYVETEVPVIGWVLQDSGERPEPAALAEIATGDTPAEWVDDDGSWFQKFSLPRKHGFNRLEGSVRIHADGEGPVEFKIYRNHPDTYNLTVLLSQITFIYLPCMALVAHLSGVLNTVKIFGMPAAAPVLLNVIFLIGLLVVTAALGIRGDPVKCAHVAAWCVFIAGFVQLAALYITCRRKGLHIRLCRPRITPRMKRLFILMGPGVLAAGIQQINLLIGGIIASFREGAISYLYYSERVYQLPLGMIGIAMGVVLLPEVTRRLRKNDQPGAVHSMNRGIELALLITLPAAVALAVIPYPIIATLFQRGAFTAEDARLTSLALAGFAFGIPGYVLVKVLQPGYFAREDTKRPMIMAAITVAVNIAVSLLLFGRLGHVGIAIATAAAAWVNVALLANGLRGFWAIDARLRQTVPKIAAASLVMGVVLWLLQKAIAGWFDDGFAMKVLGLGLLVGAGSAVYFGAALALKATSPAALRAALRK